MRTPTTKKKKNSDTNQKEEECERPGSYIALTVNNVLPCARDESPTTKRQASKHRTTPQAAENNEAHKPRGAVCMLSHSTTHHDVITTRYMHQPHHANIYRYQVPGSERWEYIWRHPLPLTLAVLLACYERAQPPPPKNTYTTACLVGKPQAWLAPHSRSWG